MKASASVTSMTRAIRSKTLSITNVPPWRRDADGSRRCAEMLFCGGAYAGRCRPATTQDERIGCNVCPISWVVAITDERAARAERAPTQGVGRDLRVRLRSDRCLV